MDHTPGPWRIEGPTLKGPKYNLGSVNSHKTTEGAANAALIAAAPDLLEALRAAYSDIQRCPGHTIDMLGRIEAAIAKATGDAA